MIKNYLLIICMEELYAKFNFPSADKFKKILERNGINATLKEVKEFIKKQSINQIHKEKKKIKNNQEFITALNAFEIVQIDLLDYQKYAKQNKGFNYILIIVDIFSRKAFAEPIKNKKPISVLNAFKKIVPEQFRLPSGSTGSQPRVKVIEHDDGKEYLADFLKYIRENDIVNITFETGNHNSLGIIDRLSRTLKSSIEKQFNYRNTTKYYDILPEIIDAYNNSPHNSLGERTPNDILKNEDDYKLVQKINIQKIQFNNSLNKVKPKVGEKVRTLVKKGNFTKGYKLSYSTKVYVIKKIDGNQAILDSGDIVSLKKLQIVNDLSNDVLNDKVEKADKDAIIKRKLTREGLT